MVGKPVGRTRNGYSRFVIRDNVTWPGVYNSFQEIIRGIFAGEDAEMCERPTVDGGKSGEKRGDRAPRPYLLAPGPRIRRARDLYSVGYYWQA